MDDTSIPEPRPSSSARRSKEWREQNPERAASYDKAYKLKHQARILQRQREYNLRRAAKKRADSQAWRAAHPEQARVASRDWGRKNPEGKRAHDAKYRESHREELRAKNRAIMLKRRAVPGYREAELARLQRWGEEHQDERRASVERRRSRKVHAAINDFTVKQWRALCKAMGYRCAYCGEKFPYKELTEEHITPLSKGGNHTLSNILPACRSCNCRKGPRDVPSPVQPFLLLEIWPAGADAPERCVCCR